MSGSLEEKIETAKILVFGAENIDRGITDGSKNVKYGYKYNYLYDYSRWLSLGLYDSKFLEDEFNITMYDPFEYYLGISGMDRYWLKSLGLRQSNTGGILKDNIINWNSDDFWKHIKSKLGNRKYKVICIDRVTLDYMINLDPNNQLNISVLKNILKYLKIGGKLVIIEPETRLKNVKNLPFLNITQEYVEAFENIGLTNYEEKIYDLNVFFSNGSSEFDKKPERQLVSDFSTYKNYMEGSLIDRIQKFKTAYNVKGTLSQIKSNLVKPVNIGFFIKSKRMTSSNKSS